MKIKEPVKIRPENPGLGLGGACASYRISLQIRDNETSAINRPRGAGKTAFLSCLDGFFLPVAGEVCYDW